MMDKAIKENNAEQAAYYAEKIQTMQENATKAGAKYEQESMNFRQDQALQASAAEKKMELDSKITKAKAKVNKPLEMKDYNDQAIRIDQSDPEKLIDKVIIPFGFDKKESITKNDLHMFNDAAAAVGGTEEVRRSRFLGL